MKALFREPPKMLNGDHYCAKKVKCVRHEIVKTFNTKGRRKRSSGVLCRVKDQALATNAHSCYVASSCC
eukprot:3463001-Amphidinium_carterae.2